MEFKNSVGRLAVTLAVVACAAVPSMATPDRPGGKICAIMQDAFIGGYSPEELCKKYDGSFCSSMKTMGQGVCAAAGRPFCEDYKSDGEAICEAGQGAFCSEVNTLAGGICALLPDGTLCSSRSDERKWRRKLAEACSWGF